jgi:FKBP-type peptidyl-prolyl cis-trans isomerase
MTRVRERLFAGFGAFLFLASACALTIFVIFQSSSGDSSNQTTASQQQACSDNQSEPTLAAPEAYKPTEPVADLQTTDLEQGSGPAAKAGDCLVVKYYGTLASNGTKFDENFTDATAFAFKLGQGQVIEGWDKGMVGLKAGGTRRLVIPAAQAYGSQSPSAAIPANSDLVFVVKLLRIQK